MSDIVTSYVDYPIGQGQVRAFLGMPTRTGPWPGVVVVHDILGMASSVRAHARRLARSGYIALAPDLYSRGIPVWCVKATFDSLNRQGGRPFDYIDGARRWLAARNDCTGAIGVIGFCLGGGFALVAASSKYHFSASAVNYGDVPPNAATILDGACPIVASYGKRDPMPANKQAAKRLRDTLASLRVEHDVQEYPYVGHSFMDDYGLLNRYGPISFVFRKIGLGYDRGASDSAWTRILTFFDQHLS